MMNDSATFLAKSGPSFYKYLIVKLSVIVCGMRSLFSLHAEKPWLEILLPWSPHRVLLGFHSTRLPGGAEEFLCYAVS